jgi:hypothetical protein
MASITVGIDLVAERILIIRGRRVMLDHHLAALYGVRPRRLREQVKRNLNRFPDDFMFQLTVEEAQALVLRAAIPSWKHLGGSLPLVFTQEGVAMLSSVLRSRRAVEVNIVIMRAFVRMRGFIGGNRKLRSRLDALEKRYDAQFKIVFDAIREMIDSPVRHEPRIGFQPKSGDR